MLPDSAATQVASSAPCRLLRELGRRGMGVVYLAERADSAYEQKVGFKLLPSSLRSEALDQRFADHPEPVLSQRMPGAAFAWTPFSGAWSVSAPVVAGDG